MPATLTMTPALLQCCDQIAAMVRDRPRDPQTIRARRDLLWVCRELDLVELNISGQRGTRERRALRILMDAAYIHSR